MSEQDEELGEFEVYEPQPVALNDGDAVILDALLFAEQHNTNVVQFKSGALWVLDNDSRKWKNVEKSDSEKPEKRPNHLKAVK